MPIGAVGIGQNANGCLHLFASTHCTGTDYVLTQVAASDGWGTWRSLGSQQFGRAIQYAAGQNVNGKLELFVLRSDGRCTQFWQDKANGEFTGSRDIGAVGWQQIAMARNTDGRPELFALVNGNIYHMYKTSKDVGGWSASQPFGTLDVTQMAVASNADGRLEVFALVGGDVWHFWQTRPDAPPGGGWSASEPFGTLDVTQMAVARNADGRLEVFALVGGNVWHFWQLAPGTWGSASQPFGTAGWTNLAVARNADGRLMVYGLAGEELWHFWQAPNRQWSSGSQFPDPEPLPWVSLTATPPYVTEGQSARLDWASGNADGLRLEPGAGPVGPSGSKTVVPQPPSTVYHLTGTHGRCTATAKATVTVGLATGSIGGAYWAANPGTQPQPVTVNLDGTWLSGTGQAGLASFPAHQFKGTLPPLTAKGAISLSPPIAGLKQGRWRVVATSNIAAPTTVNIDVPPGSVDIDVSGA